MKKMIILLILSSSSSFAGVCSLESVEKSSCSTYSTEVWTPSTVVATRGAVVIVDGRYEPRSHTVCTYWNELGLAINGVIQTDSSQAPDIFDAAERAFKNGDCVEAEAKECLIRSEDGQASLVIEDKEVVKINRANRAEANQEAKKVKALLSIRDLCK